MNRYGLECVSKRLFVFLQIRLPTMITRTYTLFPYTPLFRSPESLILQYLRRLDSGLQGVREDIGDLKRRMTGVEEGQLNLGRQILSVEEGLLGVNRRLDRLDGRVERIERRLELTEAGHCGRTRKPDHAISPSTSQRPPGTARGPRCNKMPD